MTKIDDKRVAIMRSSLSDFEGWLLDIIHKGLGELDNFSNPFHAFWQESSSQLVDGKNPTIAAWVKTLPIIMAEKSEWTNDILSKIGDIYLIIKAFEEFENFEENFQYELMMAAGWTLTSAKVRECDQKVSDTWQVIGKVEGKQDDLRFRRVWLLGKTSELPVLVLEYVFGNHNFATYYQLGTEWQSDIYFFPGNSGLRGIVTNIPENNIPLTKAKGHCSFQEFNLVYVNALLVSPWLREYPCCIEQVIPIQVEDNFFIMDKDKALIPVFCQTETIWWKIVALSGNSPIDVFGEWNGTHLEILSVFANEHFEAFSIYHRS